MMKARFLVGVVLLCLLVAWVIGYISESSEFSMMIALPFVIIFTIIFYFSPLGAMLAFFAVRSTMEIIMDQTLPIPGTFVEIAVGGVMSFFISLLGLLFILNSIYKRKFKIDRAILSAIIIFLVITAISIFAAFDRLEAIKEWGRMASLCVMFLVIALSVSNETDIRRFSLALLISCIIPFAFGIYQALTQTGFMASSQSINRIYGTFRIPNAYAAYLLFPFFLSASSLFNASLPSRIRNFYIIILSVTGLSLILTYTRASWLGALLGLAFIGYKKKQPLWLYLAIIVVVILSIVPLENIRLGELQEGNVTFGGRLVIWESVLPYFFAKPLFGHGLTNFLVIAGSALGWGRMSSQNELLRLLIETGLICTIVYCYLLWKIFKITNDNIYQHNQSFFMTFAAFLIGTVVVGFFEMNATLQWYFWMPAGIIVGYIGNRHTITPEKG